MQSVLQWQNQRYSKDTETLMQSEKTQKNHEI